MHSRRHHQDRRRDGERLGRKSADDASFPERAARHTTRVLGIHMRPDGSIVQSSELNRQTGQVVRPFTDKGFGAMSLWGRTGVLVYTAIAFSQRPQESSGMERLICGAER